MIREEKNTLNLSSARLVRTSNVL